MENKKTVKQYSMMIIQGKNQLTKASPGFYDLLGKFGKEDDLTVQFSLPGYPTIYVQSKKGRTLIYHMRIKNAYREDYRWTIAANGTRPDILFFSQIMGYKDEAGSHRVVVEMKSKEITLE